MTKEITIRALKEHRTIDKRRYTRKNYDTNLNDIKRAVRASNRCSQVIIREQTNASSDIFDDMIKLVLWNSILSNNSNNKVVNKIIINESRGSKEMTENELRDSIKDEVGKVIDNIYNKVSNANNLKVNSKYSFNITINNPITKDVISKKISLQGDEIMAVRDLINKNRVKAYNIKRILKKEAWKIVYSIIKESI